MRKLIEKSHFSQAVAFLYNITINHSVFSLLTGQSENAKHIENHACGDRISYTIAVSLESTSGKHEGKQNAKNEDGYSWKIP